MAVTTIQVNAASGPDDPARTALFVKLMHGAIAISILPVLHAMPGAVAYLLRSHEQQSKNRALVAGKKPIARIPISGIAGW